MSTAVGEIITVNGRKERVTERVPVTHHDTGEILYYALRSEPLEDEAPADAGK
jgi:hypothetical protein